MPLPKIAHPLITTKLPSTGQSVEMRPMLGSEEKVLLMAKESGEHQEILTTVLRVVDACVVTQVDVYALPIFDVEWLFIQLRIASVSPVSPVSYVDQADKLRYDFEVDLTKVEVVRPDVESRLTLSDKVAVDLVWPPATAFVAASVVDRATEAEVAHELGVSCVGTVYDGDSAIDPKTLPRAEVDEFVSSLPLEQYKRLMDFVAAIPTLSYVIRYTNRLGEEREVRLSNLTDFFRFR